MAVVGDQDSEGVSLPLPLLVALYTLVAVPSASGVVGVQVARDWASNGATSSSVVALAHMAWAGVVLGGW